MFGHEFYHGTLRRYVIIFGTLFNEIIISRDDNNGTQQKRFKVPIAYGPMQKFLAMIQSNPNLTQKQAITLPRMSFEFNNVVYDPERRLTSLVRNTKSISSNDAALYSNYAPAPYNIDVTLSIMAKYSEDGTKILEQILPFFKPEWTTSVKLVDDIPDYYDIPTILTSVSSEEIYEGSYQERQVIIWSLTFTMKGYFFGPVQTKKIIKFANTNFYTDLVNGTYSATPSERIRVYPGLLANGSPADYTSEQVIQATALASITDDTADPPDKSVSSIAIVNSGLGYNSATITIDPPALLSYASNTQVSTGTHSAYIDANTVTFDTGKDTDNIGTVKFDYYYDSADPPTSGYFYRSDKFKVKWAGDKRITVEVRRLTDNALLEAITFETLEQITTTGWYTFEFSFNGNAFSWWTTKLPFGFKTLEFSTNLSTIAGGLYYTNQVFLQDGQFTLGDTTLSQYYDNLIIYDDAISNNSIFSEDFNQGVTATAIANVTNDFIRSIEVTNGGTKYRSVPVVTISAPDDVSVGYSSINKDDNWDYVIVTDNIEDI